MKNKCFLLWMFAVLAFIVTSCNNDDGVVGPDNGQTTVVDTNRIILQRCDSSTAYLKDLPSGDYSVGLYSNFAVDINGGCDSIVCEYFDAYIISVRDEYRQAFYRICNFPEYFKNMLPRKDTPPFASVASFTISGRIFEPSWNFVLPYPAVGAPPIRYDLELTSITFKREE